MKKMTFSATTSESTKELDNIFDFDKYYTAEMRAKKTRYPLYGSEPFESKKRNNITGIRIGI